MKVLPVDASRTNGTTILVVDDDALINIGTADMIQELGYRSVEAFSGQEALDVLASDHTVGLVITDYSMPGMNGVELAGKAREMRPGLSVILATGYDELPGGEHVDLPRLAKPFQSPELDALLRTLLTSA